MVERGLAESPERAKSIIMSGNVFIAGQRAEKPGMQVEIEAEIEIRPDRPYVSRGGQKLEKALNYFNVSPEGKVCIDCGASTGGFTECLLNRGASLVYAIDVGYGQLAWKIRNDPRVVTMERTNIRHVTSDMIESKPEIAVIDLSFISLSLVLPVVRKLLDENGEALCLIKPQFEADRGSIGNKGVVRDPMIHSRVLEAFIQNAVNSGFCAKGITYSPIKGPEGNIEYLGRLCCRGESETIDISAAVSESHRVLNNEF